MADKKPIKATYSGTDTNGLAEFVAADTIGVADGGTGLTTVATSNLLTGNGASALSAEANLTFDGTNLTMGTGNLIVGTSGKGIDFSATSDAGGASSEVLDDYEEGTWTPVIKYGGASGTAYSLGTPVATYTKIGRVVYFSCEVTVTNPSASNDTSVVFVQGLPFTSANIAQWWRVHDNWTKYTNSVGVPMGAVHQNDTAIIQYQQQNNGAWGADIISSEIYQSSGSIGFHSSGFYHTA